MKKVWDPERSVSRMSFEDRVRQLFMLGFDGKRIEEGLKDLLEELRPGGIIIFSRNVKSRDQLRELLSQANGISFKLTGTPLLISIDQEGGIVARIRKGFAVFPGNMALGATYSPENAYSVGKAVGEQLKWFGINVNLAPVLDIILDKTNPSIGVRSFGDDPIHVSKMGGAMIAGLRESGIIAVAKHFPGIGAASIDPHIDLPVLDIPLDVLRKREFVPFAEAIKEGVEAIMPSHVVVPEIDPDMPATLSKKLIEGTLRGELGFHGAILSDDLLMGAVSRRYSLTEASFLTLKAGEDMALICRDFEEQMDAIDFVIKAAERGDLPKERVVASICRVMNLKKKVSGMLGKKPNFERLFHLERRVCEESVTLVKLREGCLPLLKGSLSKILVVCPQRTKKLVETGVSSSTLGEKIRSKGFNVAEIFFEEEDAVEAIEESIKHVLWADYIVICTREVLRFNKEAELVRELNRVACENDKCLIIASLGTPYDILAFPEVENYLAVYDYHEPMQDALVSVLLGKLKPKGRLPVSVDGMFHRGHGISPEVYG